MLLLLERGNESSSLFWMRLRSTGYVPCGITNGTSGYLRVVFQKQIKDGGGDAAKEY